MDFQIRNRHAVNVYANFAYHTAQLLMKRGFYVVSLAAMDYFCIPCSLINTLFWYFLFNILQLNEVLFANRATNRSWLLDLFRVRACSGILRVVKLSRSFAGVRVAIAHSWHWSSNVRTLRDRSPSLTYSVR